MKALEFLVSLFVIIAGILVYYFILKDRKHSGITIADMFAILLIWGCNIAMGIYAMYLTFYGAPS